MTLSSNRKFSSNRSGSLHERFKDSINFLGASRKFLPIYINKLSILQNFLWTASAVFRKFSAILWIGPSDISLGQFHNKWISSNFIRQLTRTVNLPIYRQGHTFRSLYAHERVDPWVNMSLCSCKDYTCSQMRVK